MLSRWLYDTRGVTVNERLQQYAFKKRANGTNTGGK
jgi:hypothetical protein